MSWEEECTENREAVWDSPWDKFITFSLIVSNHGTLFRNCICSQDCTNLPVLRGKGSSASANSCPLANSNTSRSNQLFQEKGVHNLNCALQTCNRLSRWREEGHPSNLLKNPCLGSQHLPSDGFPSHTEAAKGQLQLLRSRRWNASKKARDWENPISVRQKPREIIPTSMNRQWNKPILVFVFLSCLLITLLAFFLQNWEAAEIRPSWLNLLESKEYTDCPVASDFFHKSLLFSFPSPQQSKQLVKSRAEAGSWCQLEMIILRSLPSHVLSSMLPIHYFKNA